MAWGTYSRTGVAAQLENDGCEQSLWVRRLCEGTTSVFKEQEAARFERRFWRFQPNIEHRTCFVENFVPFPLSTTSPRPSPPFHGGEGDGKPKDFLNDSHICDGFYRAHRTSNSEHPIGPDASPPGHTIWHDAAPRRLWGKDLRWHDKAVGRGEKGARAAEG